jgi:hypothetical protein
MILSVFISQNQSAEAVFLFENEKGQSYPLNDIKS